MGADAKHAHSEKVAVAVSCPSRGLGGEESSGDQQMTLERSVSSESHTTKTLKMS